MPHIHIFNHDVLQALTQGDPAAQAKLLAGFQASGDVCYRGLSHALATGDDQAWRKAVLGFKDVCIRLGADPADEYLHGSGERMVRNACR